MLAWFDGVLQRFGDVEGVTNRLAAVTDGLSADLTARQIILEERLARLEGKVRAGPAISADSSHTLPDGLSTSFERIISEQRNELIVFGLSKVPSENCTETITRVSFFLDVLMSSSEIAPAFRNDSW